MKLDIYCKLCNKVIGREHTGYAEFFMTEHFEECHKKEYDELMTEAKKLRALIEHYGFGDGMSIDYV